MAPQRRLFVEEKRRTGAGVDLQHAGIHCCCFHSYLQNSMKSAIESRGASFSSACFLDRAELSVCCWTQAGKNQVSVTRTVFFFVVFFCSPGPAAP